MSRPVAIIIGVLATIALLIAAWRIIPAFSGRAAEESEMATLDEQVSRNTTTMQQQLEASVSGQLYDAAHERMDSPLGQALSRRCADWTDLSENHPSDDNQQNRDRACAELREYVNSGTVPAEFDDQNDSGSL